MRALLQGRRPLVIAALVMIVCAVASVLAPAPRPVYSLDALLVLQASNATGAGNAYRADTANRVYFAAAIERAYNVSPTDARVASNAATLYGIGIRDGSRVTLPDRGSQWGSNFNQPTLRVEVVSPSEAETRKRFAGIVEQLRVTAARLQHQVGVDDESQVQLELIPSDPGVLTVGGSRVKQTATGILLGGLAGAGVYGILSRRRRGWRTAHLLAT